MFCSNCGSALAAGAGGMPPAPVPVYMGTPGLASPMEAERRTQIGRTKTGLLLLLIGTLIRWIPYFLAGLLGGLLLLIGAILVILGRKAFGSTHARNVMIALALFIVGIIGAVALGVLFAISLIGSIGGQDPRTIATAFGNALNSLLLGLVILTAIAGIASVLFTYDLQKQPGKILLWAAYVANLAITIAVWAIISPAIQKAINDAVATGTYNPAPLQALQSQQNSLALLSVIPSVLFAAATYLAWARVNRGEIPPATTPPGMSAAAAPMPPR